MTSGLSVALAALGAILAFAVRDNFQAVDLTAVGYILMAAGLAGLVISLMRSRARGRTSIVENTTATPNGAVRTTDVDHGHAI